MEFDNLCINPPRLEKQLNECAWDYYLSLLNNQVLIPNNSKILVSWNLCVGFHNTEELLDKDRKDYVYDLFYFHIKDGVIKKKHQKAFGDINQIKSEFDISLV